MLNSSILFPKSSKPSNDLKFEEVISAIPMDRSLLLHRPAGAVKPKTKRPCCSASTDSSRIPNKNSVDELLESFLQPSNVWTIAPALELSLERIIESTNFDSEKNNVIERALRFGSTLIEVAQKADRKRASFHNSVVWALPYDLTIKVFSMLDAQSVCYAATACSFFHKCAADPLCYSYIDLTTTVPKVDNLVVSTMIQRAGKALRSLKLGVLPSPHVGSPDSSRAVVYSMKNSADSSGFSWIARRFRQGKDLYILTRSCLSPLIAVNGCAPGALLIRLHLYNIERMDNIAFGVALSACPSLLDLKVVGMHFELRQTLESVSSCCHSIERLFFESSKTGRDDSLKLSTCTDLVSNCPNLSSLALRGFKLCDIKIRVLLKGFHKLKFIDFSTSYSITGDFLKNLGGSVGGSLLEVVILRDCMHLREAEVTRLLSAILAGSFKYLRHLDISNREGLAFDNHHYLHTPSFTSLAEVLEQRPNLRVVADFPAEGSFEDEPMNYSDSDFSSSMTSSFDDSFVSDQSGDILEESSDDFDYP